MSMQCASSSTKTPRPQAKLYNGSLKSIRFRVVNSCRAGTILGKFSECESWQGCRALADVLYIYPFKADKKTFDDNKDELGFSSKIKVAKKKKSKEDLERERIQRLKDEED